MSLTNQAKRLDILQIDGNAHVFTLQLLNTTDGNYIDFDINPLSLVLKDARGVNAGTPAITLVTPRKASIDVAAIVPSGYSGTLKYTIAYTDTGSGSSMQLLKGNIDCVDSVHMPADTTDYITNGNEVTVEADFGVTNNIILHIANGVPGATGPQGPQGIQGPQGLQGDGLNSGFLIIDNWVDGTDALDMNNFFGDILIVVNNTTNPINIKLTNYGAYTLVQPYAMPVPLVPGNSMVLYKIHGFLLYKA